MDEILEQFKRAKKKYDKKIDSSIEIKQTVVACIQKMHEARSEDWPGPAGKEYLVFTSGESKSRPFLKTQLIATVQEFERQWDALFNTADRDGKRFTLPSEQVTKILYNAVLPFCVCFDIWKPKSRKTPGTFFEIVIGTLISRILPLSVNRTKHISLPAESVLAASGILQQEGDDSLIDLIVDDVALEESSDFSQHNVDGQRMLFDDEDGGLDGGQKVSTDIVFDFDGKGLVIPAKITTRERVVQPFAHQRILDGVFGSERYISLLMCVSETQRSDKDRRINDICVPGTITLFQKHLAEIGGIYYLDPPERYLALGQTGIVSIQSLGSLLTSGLAEVIRQLDSTPTVSSELSALQS